ncbi:hypothetical protein M2146_000347 [Lachnospiraceae bacterium PF1-22]|uniref:DEAD/DEAH box helicase n=1 Tax=Ohessyouella blattaphilus TaxID=2949333 RepID=UPI003E28802A
MYTNNSLASNHKFVSDEIGNEYEQWINRDLIFIETSTGSGKTHFVITKLLPYAIQHGRKILYLVNRRILKEQLEHDIVSTIRRLIPQYCMAKPDDLDNIEVLTYQYIENKLRSAEAETFIAKLRDFSYVICDECHYFYADSNFNTNTELSFDCIQKIFSAKIRVFMSATMDNIKPFILNKTPLYHFNDKDTNGMIKNDSGYLSLHSRPPFEYSTKITHPSFDISILNRITDLAEYILHPQNDGSTQWLIFTDSIKQGNTLLKKLKPQSSNRTSLADSDIVFIDADYKKNEDALDSVKHITENKFADKRVIISTSVMDNGISFHDTRLRNIFISTDTKESFVQMLGRKRDDNQTTHLFILRRDKQFFHQRLRLFEQVASCIEHYQPKLNYNFNYAPLNYNSNYAPHINAPMRHSPYFAIEDNTSILDCTSQDSLLNTLLGNINIYKNISTFCYSFKGIITYNEFSIRRIYHMIEHYKSILKKLEEDKNAFIKEQASWINIDGMAFEEIVTSSIKNEEDQCKEKIINVLESLLNTNLNRNQNISNLKIPILDALHHLLSISNNNKITKSKLETFKKKDRPISKESFNLYMSILNLPYEMKTKMLLVKGDDADNKSRARNYSIHKNN